MRTPACLKAHENTQSQARSLYGAYIVVGVDLLPENAMNEGNGGKLVSGLSAAVNHVQSEQVGDIGGALEGVLEIMGPSSKISKVYSKGKAWFIALGKWSPSARLFHGVDMSEDEISKDDELFCLSCIVLRKEADGTILRRSRQEVQGLVLRRLEKRDRWPDVFERAGFFTANRTHKPSSPS